MLFPYRSQTVAYAAGTRNVDLDFLPRRGERGGRLVINRVDIHCAARYTTGAGVTLDNLDLSGIVRELRIRDGAGFRRKATGPLLKIHAQSVLGEKMPDDAADVNAATANQDRITVLPVVFALPDDFAPDDSSIPVDDLLDNGQVELEMPTDAQLNWAGGTGTIVAANTSYVFTFWCREEFDVQFKSRDELNYIDQDAAATIRLPVLGNLLRSLWLHLDAAGGGTTVTTITDVTFDALRVIVLPRNHFQVAYRTDHEPTRVFAEDIVGNSLAMPLIFPHRHSKMRDYPRIDGLLLGRLTTTMAAARMLHHQVTPKDARAMANALAVNGVRPGAPITVKTKGKSMRDVEDWGQFGLYMPWKAGR